ncbi:hypothetical protein Salat_0686800 [Sesamum alatum]|uniref:Uncharacterized protein n=1 Tax=Sesamum alatum TaxID=300844 RepID=A0AAE1YRT3_9LAMI|nr:hypothetical protein Salat_0686800 [Sesamum alatum]
MEERLDSRGQANEPLPRRRVVNVIEGGEYGGLTRSAQKRHARELSSRHIMAIRPEDDLRCPIMTLTVGVQEEGGEKVKPSKSIRKVRLNLKYENRVVQVGESLPAEEETTLLQFLQRKDDVFKWGKGQSPGIDAGIIEHELHAISGDQGVAHAHGRGPADKEDSMQAA